MKITYWSDYACPYCYIGEARLKKALDQIPELKGTEIEMKSFQLDPSAGQHAEGDTQTRFAHKYGISYEAAGRQIETISQMGRAEGIDFKYATTLFTNTMDAHRLTKLAQQSGDQELTDRLSERLYKAYFAEGLELADHGVLLRIAREEGMDAERVKALLAADEFSMDVRLDEREAARYGVRGVPYFVLNNQLAIPGALPVERMEQAIREAMESEKQTQEEGMTCGPEGCRIADHQV